MIALDCPVKVAESLAASMTVRSARKKKKKKKISINPDSGKHGR